MPDAGRDLEMEPRRLDVAKVEMSPATIQALRMMMREEISHGISEVETRLTHKMEVAHTHTHLLAKLTIEAAERVQLEDRVRRLEQQIDRPDVEKTDVDKSPVVIGGFGDKAQDEAEALLQEVLSNVEGYQDVSFAGSETPPWFGQVRVGLRNLFGHRRHTVAYNMRNYGRQKIDLEKSAAD